MGNPRSSRSQADFKLIWARRAGQFLGFFAVTYGSLMALWPIGGVAYARLYCMGANRLLGAPGARAVVYFSQPGGGRDEVRVTFYDRQRTNGQDIPRPLLRIAHNVRYGVYMYVAFLAALVLATPLPWRRRAWASLWGLVLIHAFMGLRLTLLVVQLLNSEQVALLALNWFWKSVLLLSVQILTVNILPSFLVAIFIWALVSFRREDWRLIVGQQSPATRTQSVTCPLRR